MNYWLLLYSFGLVTSFLLSLVLTELSKTIAIKLGILDHPHGRKVHKKPTPLLGGVGIFISFHATLILISVLYRLSENERVSFSAQQILGFLGLHPVNKIWGLILGGWVIFLLGIVDDLKSLSPWMKLFGQIFSACIVVYSGVRIEMFLLSDTILSTIITIGWIVLITNSLNLLDNMDGLSGGFSFIACFSFFLCIQPYDEIAIRMLLVIFAGSMAGFLFHNIHPAKIFMGDAGSMFSGYFLACISVLGTFHLEGTPSRVSIFAPVIILSVPLFDTFSVMYLRWRSGQSIFLGDKRHFSHRLVELGMTPRQAVEFIWLVGIITGLQALFLPLVNIYLSILILLQVGGIYLLIVLLMNAHKTNSNGFNGNTLK